MNNYSDLSIIIPTINEKDNLTSLIYVLNEMYPQASILIADDGSTDGTIEFIEDVISKGFNSPIYLLSRNNNCIYTNNTSFNNDLFNQDKLNIRNTPGLTAAVLDALTVISTSKFAVIDADFQHPPKLVSDMYDKLQENDLVCAHRIKLEGFPPHRKLITWLGTRMANSALPKHSRVNDPLSGAFGGKIENLKECLFNPQNFKLEGFKILFDLLKAIPDTIKIGQAGYEFKMRKEGESKISFKHLWLFFKSIFNEKDRKFYNGLALLGLFIFTGAVLLTIFGDFNLTASMRAFAKARPGFLKFCKFVTDYGNPFYYIIFIGILIKGLITKNKKLVKVFLIYLLVQLVASLIITGGVKIIVGRPRPGKGFEHHFFTGHSKYKSFPSGHTTDAFASAGVMWAFLKPYPLSLISFLYSFFIGLTRIFVGSHYFLDVIAGMTVGFLTALLIFRKKL
jgi:membrane-associated phospholipid phosphatase